MITQTFNGKIISEPGFYTAKKAANTTPVLNTDYGVALIANVGVNHTFDQTPGFPFKCEGEIVDVSPAFFDSLDDFQEDVFAGPFAQLSNFLFKPSKDKTLPGVSSLGYIKVCDASPARAIFKVGSGGSAFGLQFFLNKKYAGSWGNTLMTTDPVTNTSKLKKGFLAKMRAGKTANTYIVDFFKSAYGGDDKLNQYGTATVEVINTAETKATQVNSIAGTLTTMYNSHGSTGFIWTVSISYYGGLYKYPIIRYTQLSGDTTPTILWTSIAAAINAGTTGFTAAVAAGNFTLTMPAGYGSTYNYNYVGLDGQGTAGGFGLWLGYFNGGINVDKTITQVILNHAYIGPDYRDVEVKRLITSTPEITTVRQLVDFFIENNELAQFFDQEKMKQYKLDHLTNTQLNTTLVSGDQTQNETITFGSGSEVTSNEVFEDFLDYIKELKYNYIFTDDSVEGNYNTLLFNHVTTEAKFDKVLGVGSANVISDAIATSQYYDSEKVLNTFGTFGKVFNDGKKIYSNLAKLAIILGRICGLPPEVPGTFKDLDYDYEVYPLTSERDRKKLLSAGVLHTKLDTDFNEFIINQSISTLQNNKQFIASDGQSYEHSISRIGFQLNRILYAKSKAQFQKQVNGVTSFTASPETVEAFTNKVLYNEVAKDNQSGLILYYQEVKSVIKQDGIWTSYAYKPNTPINKFFFIGYQID
jgi:hypothetical protein